MVHYLFRNKVWTFKYYSCALKHFNYRILMRFEYFYGFSAQKSGEPSPLSADRAPRRATCCPTSSGCCGQPAATSRALVLFDLVAVEPAFTQLLANILHTYIATAQRKYRSTYVYIRLLFEHHRTFKTYRWFLVIEWNWPSCTIRRYHFQIRRRAIDTLRILKIDFTIENWIS